MSITSSSNGKRSRSSSTSSDVHEAEATVIPVAVAQPAPVAAKAVAAKPAAVTSKPRGAPAPAAAYAAGEAAGAHKENAEMSSCQRHYKGWIWGTIIACAIALIVAIVCAVVIPDDDSSSGNNNNGLPADSMINVYLSDDGKPVGVDLSSTKYAKDLFNNMNYTLKLGQMNQYTYSDATGPAALTLDWDTAVAEGVIGAMFNMPNLTYNNHLQQIAMDNGVPPILYGYDNVHGYWTIFPCNIGIGASFDIDLVQKMFNVMGSEARSDGIHQAFSPMVDTSRDSRWGRLSESFGEDPVLTASLARAAVRGHKEVGHMSCVKHFAAYGGAESGRDYNLVDMSPERMFNEYLPAYKAAVEEGAISIMTSFNSLNWVPSTGNRDLLTNILKKSWGFKGLVVSDYTAVDELVNHGLGKDKNESSLFALKAGLDQEMAGGIWGETLKDNVDTGVVDQSFVDAAAQRILYAKESIGLGDITDSKSYITDPALQDQIRMNQTNLDLARVAAEQTCVLLKNGTPKDMSADDIDSTTNERGKIIPAEGIMLPIASDTKKILLIGSLANSRLDQLGNWAGHGDQTVENITTLAAYLGCKYSSGTIADPDPLPAYITSQPNVVCTYAPGYYADSGEEGVGVDGQYVDELTSITNIFAAISTAKDEDSYGAIVYVMGEAANSSGEATSRSDLRPCCGQRAAWEQILTEKSANENLASVPLVNIIFGARGMTVEDYASEADAMIMAWFPGTLGGPAIWNLLTNQAEQGFVGRLPISFPRDVGQCPIYYSRPWTGRPHNIAYDVGYNDLASTGDNVHFTSRYIDVKTEALFNFGHGLSYTQLDYSTAVTASGTMKASDPSSSATFTTTITNNGEVDAYDIPQLYIHQVSHWGIARTFPKRQLKAFKKVQVTAGNSVSVSFTLTADDFGYYNSYLSRVIDASDYEVYIGPSNDPDWDRMTYFGYPLSPGGNMTYTIQA